MIITDGEGKIRYINSQAKTTFGFTLEELQGEPVEILIPTHLRVAHPKLRKTFTEKPHQRPMGIGLDLVGLRKNGEEFPVEIGLSTVSLNNELHILCYITDISKRKEIERQLVRSETRFRKVIDAAPDAVILIDQGGLIIQINKTGERIFGYPQGSLIGIPVETLLPKFNAQTQLEQRMENSLDPGDQKNGIGYKMKGLRKDGTTFPVELDLSPLSLEGENMTIALVRDISERIQIESRLNLLAQIVQQMKDAVILTDSDLESKIRYVNKAFTDLYGYSKDEILGKSSWVLFAGNAEASKAIIQKRDRNIQLQDKFKVEYQERKKDGSLFWVSNTSSVIRLDAGEKHYDLGIVRDISERVHSQEILRKRNAFLADLHETSLDILSQLDLNIVLESLTNRAAGILGCKHGFVYIMEPNQEEMLCPVGIGLFTSMVGSRLKKGEGFMGLIWETGQTQMWTGTQTQMAYPEPNIPEEIHCGVGVPLRWGNEVIGILGMADDDESPNHFGADEIDMLSYYGELASIAIQNAQLFSKLQQVLQVTEHQKARMDRELEIARSVQFALLPPHFPELENWSFAAMWKPALEVAGDFYDVILREDGYFDLIIADVTDKGAPAALFMAYSKSVMNFHLSSAPSLLEGVVHANQTLVQKAVGPYVTAFMARIHAESGEMVYINAGHPAAVVYNSETDQLIELANTSFPLGITSDEAFEQHTIQLGKNDFLVLYTDGVTEATDLNQDMFGNKRLMDAIYRHRGGNVKGIAQGLSNEVDNFISRPHLTDDITILVTKRS
jgi:PAS domain S-box-containing protein